MRALIPLLALLLTPYASAADYTFTGFARELDSGKLMYVESHAVRDGGTSQEKRVVLYRETEAAAPFARKLLTYGADRARPEFQFADARSGYDESVSRQGSRWQIRAQAGARASVRSESLALEDVSVIDAGFDEFVRGNWAALQAGKAVDAPFLVPSRLDAYAFRVRKTGGTRIGGAEATVIKLSLAGALGWFVSDLEVVYRDSDRKLLRYRGLTNIRNAAGKLLEAQIDFPDEGVTTNSVDLDQLMALPLKGS